MVYFGFFFSSFPLEETPTGEGRGKGAASDFSSAKAGGTLFVVVYLLLPAVFVQPRGEAALRLLRCYLSFPARDL